MEVVALLPSPNLTKGRIKMAKAKCKICGNELDTKTAYKITDQNGKNKYFCSESEFEKEEERKKKIAEDKDKVYRLICDIMDTQEIVNTALYKEWVEWSKVATNSKIAQYLEENKSYLTSAIKRLSSTEYAKIRYLSAVLKNSLKDYKPQVIEQPKPKVNIDETIYNTPSKIRSRRRSLSDLEDEI